MKITKMTSAIVDILKREHDCESIDVKQICDFCMVYEDDDSKSRRRQESSTASIDFSSPHFKKVEKKRSKRELDINSSEFERKYSYFAKIVYASLRLGVKLFEETSYGEVLKNNHQLVRAIETRKKEYVAEHIAILKSHHQNPAIRASSSYPLYLESYLKKIKILDDLRAAVVKLVERDILKKNDNMISLLAPYFYSHVRCIERYG